jgi:AcrR family transcriptional regulator
MASKTKQPARRSAQSSRRKPGRPDKKTFARERILSAAEQVFSKRGYERASFSEIVKHAKVTQALVNYYFGSKELLFKEVYLRRANEIVQGRREALDDLTRRGKASDLSELLSAFLNPAFAMPKKRGGKAFLRLQWRLLHSEPPNLAKTLHRQVYDETARQYVEAIRKIVPGLSKKAAYWRIVFVMGMYAYVHSDAHRIDEISQGLCNANDLAELSTQAKAFILAGMKAPTEM